MALDRVRRENLLTLVGEYPRRVFCECTGLAVSHLRHLIAGHQALDEGTARQVEAGLKLPPGWMDQVHCTPEAGAAGIPEALPAREQVLVVKFRQLDPADQAHIEALIDTLLAAKGALTLTLGASLTGVS